VIGSNLCADNSHEQWWYAHRWRGTATLVATGSGDKDAVGYATDGDINARGTQIAARDVALNATRDINLQSAKDASQQTSSNSSTNASIGVGVGLGGTKVVESLPRFQQMFLEIRNVDATRTL
jgi:hypothetical protein